MFKPRWLVRLPNGVPQFTGVFGHNQHPLAGGKELFEFSDYDLIWVVDGRGEWRLDENLTLQAGKDDFVFLPSFTPSVYFQVAPPLRMWFCHFSFRAAPSRMPPHVRADYPTSDRALVPMVFSRREAPGVWAAYRALRQIRFSRRHPWQLERGVLSLVSALHDFATATEIPSGQEFGFRAGVQKRIQEILDRIDADPARAWTVAELAKTAGLSPGYLHTLCRRQLKYGLKHYLIRVRLRLAIRLLLTGEEKDRPSIKSISEKCGFSSQHYFCRQFRTFFCVTPSAYRAGSALYGLTPYQKHPVAK